MWKDGRRQVQKWTWHGKLRGGVGLRGEVATWQGQQDKAGDFN